MFEEVLKKNPFELFGFKESYEINLEELDKAYFKVQNLCHPDRDKQSSYESSNLISQHVNQSYQQLKNPVKRAWLLFQKMDAISFKNIESIQDPELLEEMMELREALSSMSVFQEIEDFKKSLKEEMNAIGLSFQQALKDKDKKLLKDFYLKLNYLQKIIEEAILHQQSLSTKAL